MMSIMLDCGPNILSPKEINMSNQEKIHMQFQLLKNLATVTITVTVNAVIIAA